MKTKSRIIVSVISLILILGLYMVYYHYGNSFGVDFMSIKTPKEYVKIMRSNYKNGSTKEVLNNYTIAKYEYDIEAYENMIINAPKNKDSLRIHFIQLTEELVKKNEGLANYENKLYIAFEYFNENQNKNSIFFIWDKYSQIINLDYEEFSAVQNNYFNDIK